MPRKVFQYTLLILFTRTAGTKSSSILLIVIVIVIVIVHQDGRDKVKLDSSDRDCYCLPRHQHTSSPPQPRRVPQTGDFCNFSHLWHFQFQTLRFSRKLKTDNWKLNERRSYDILLLWQIPQCSSKIVCQENRLNSLSSFLLYTLKQSSPHFLLVKADS